MRKWILALSCLVSTVSHASPLVTVGMPTYSGTGCPEDSVDAVFVPDYSAVSIAFSELTTQALPRERTHLGCKLNIPLKVEKGVRAIIEDSDFEGFMSLPSKAFADFFAVYRLYQGSRLRGWDVVSETGKGPYNGSFLVEETHRDRLISPCGGNFSLDLDIGMGIRNQSRIEAASFTIDSTNLAAYEGSMYFYVRTEKCK